MHKDLKLADHYSKCNEDDQKHFSEKIMDHIRNSTKEEKPVQASFSNVLSLNEYKKANDF